MGISNKKHLKKIPVEELRTGMFLNEICGSWMDHPFWNTKFLIKESADLNRIRAASIKEVWIDTSRGLDTETPASGAEDENFTAEELDALNERELIETATLTVDAPPSIELQAEVARATAICGRAKNVVTNMFGEARMGKAVSAGNLEPLVDEIFESVARNPGALVSLARLKDKDDYTYMHSVAVCGLMLALARQLRLDEGQSRETGMAGMMHDLGKAAVPLEILNKPGKLTDAEFDRVKSHPERGYEMLLEGGSASEIPLDVCLHHHEKVNGRGYPEGLDAESLSLYAKMGAVCDVYDAITSDRPYKAGWDPATAIRKMKEWSEGHFDPLVFQAFAKTVGIYPVGSLVQLESGKLAVVSEVADESLLTPVVRIFYCTRGKMRVPVKVIDLSSADDQITGWESPEDWNFADLDELWSGIDCGTARRAGAA